MYDSSGLLSVIPSSNKLQVYTTTSLIKKANLNVSRIYKYG